MAVDSSINDINELKSVALFYGKMSVGILKEIDDCRSWLFAAEKWLALVKVDLLEKHPKEAKNGVYGLIVCTVFAINVNRFNELIVQSETIDELRVLKG